MSMAAKLGGLQPLEEEEFIEVRGKYSIPNKISPYPDAENFTLNGRQTGQHV